MTTDQSFRDAPDDPELPAWMQVDDAWEDDEGTQPRFGRARLLAVLAALPWLLALVLVVRSGGSDAATSATAETSPAPSATTGAAAGAHTVGSGSPDDGGVTLDVPQRLSTTPPPATTANRPRVTVTAADAVAMATAVARAWLTGVGPRLEIADLEAPPSSYAEHLVAEAIDHPAPGLAVVTLLGVVLEVDGDRYRGADVRRLAVPVALDARGAHPAGSPWWLPSPDLEPAVVEGTTTDDPDLQLEAVMATEAAGYRDVELLDLAVTDSWPLIVTLRAIAPGQTETRAHELWLRPHFDGLVVAGWLPEPIGTTPEERP